MSIAGEQIPPGGIFPPSSRFLHDPARHGTDPGPLAPDLQALSEGRVAFRATGDPAEVAAGKLTLEVIRAELERIVAERSSSDPRLHHLDGRALYGEQDAAELPLPDALHPDGEAHLRMGRRFASLAFGASGPFAQR